MLVKILTLILIAALVFYILNLILDFIEKSRQVPVSEQEKIKKEEELNQTQIHLLFAPIFILLLLVWKYQSVLDAFIPILTVFYWIFVIGLIVTLMLILALLYRKYSLDKANSSRLQQFKSAVGDMISTTLILYAYFHATTSHAPAKLVVLFFLYYFIQRIYIRIIKQVDFTDESEDQQDQTRFNNKILLFFPIWCLIFFLTSKPIEFFVTLNYLNIFYNYYNRPLPIEEKWPVIKAPIGSPERAELYWLAFNAIEEPPIEIHVSKTQYTEEMQELNRYHLFAMGLDSVVAADEYSPGHSFVLRLGDDEKDEDEFDDDLFTEEMKLKVSEFRNYRRYMQRKKYPIHEDYLWWLMADVPFYFTVRAFFEMLWDTICNILRLLLLSYICIWPVWCISPYSHINTHNVYALVDHMIISLIWAYIIVWYMGITNLTRPYSWLIFYYRKEAYRMYDFIHPYAIYGPTIDGPRNWQYWFFIVFNHFPVRALILQRELFAEEIRISEGLLKLNAGDIDDPYDADDYNEELIIWNPIFWYRLRNATPQEREEIKQTMLRDQQAQKMAKEKEKIFKQLEQPKWWTHYSI